MDNDIEYSNINCSICLKDNIPHEEKCFTNCNHSFCKECIDEWFDTGENTCPLCRQKIKYFHHNNEKNRIVILRRTRDQQPQLALRNQNQFVGRSSRYCFCTTFLFGLLMMMTNSFFVIMQQNKFLAEEYIKCNINSTDLSERLNTYRDLLNDCDIDYGNMVEYNNQISNNDDSLILVSLIRNTDTYKCIIPLSFYNQCFNY